MIGIKRFSRLSEIARAGDCGYSFGDGMKQTKKNGPSIYGELGPTLPSPAQHILPLFQPAFLLVLGDQRRIVLGWIETTNEWDFNWNNKIIGWERISFELVTQ